MLSRREFLFSALAAGTAAGARAQEPPGAPAVLRLERRVIEVNGKAASVFGIRQPNGAAGIEIAAGTPFQVRTENLSGAPSLIHWHGLTPPWRQDGVAGISSPPIPPGGSAAYDFPLPFGGTFWMHAHYGLQEQLLMSAPLIIRDRTGAGMQEAILMLNDFSFTPPEEIYARLRRGSLAGMQMGPMDHMGMGHMGMAAQDASQMGGEEKGGMAGRAMASESAMPDLNDVPYDAFLANDRTLADPEIVKAEPGSQVLLRIINGASMSGFYVDLGLLEGDVIAADGHAVAPVRGRRFPLAAAQRLDIRLQLPPGPGAYPVLAILEGERRQTGIILATAGANVTRVPELAEAPAPPLTLGLESELRALEPLKPRPADRRHVLNLTGEMDGYQWSVNGVAWTPAVPPLPIAEGERVELVFVNQTAMPHPMHLHGHVFQVVAVGEHRFQGAMRDTILVPPWTRVTVAFDANNPGWWALHCHLLYHMEAGMFTTLRYA